MFPLKDELTICFAHSAYHMKERFEARRTGIRNFEIRTYDELQGRIGEAHVVVIAAMWKNDLISRASKLRFIQSISSGMDQYSKEQLAARNVRLASAAGSNASAAAEHALALILSLIRRIPEARDFQRKRIWRDQIKVRSQREDEISGKTLLIVGMGRIGSHLAKFARSFDMKVIGIRRDPKAGTNGADSIHPLNDMVKLLPQADIVAIACALKPETVGLMNARAFAAMKPSSLFVNVARGRIADEAALIAALGSGGIAAAALDVTAEEPLPVDSPLWMMPNVLITPHTAGESHAYEDNVIDILLENLQRLWRGEDLLKNQVL